MSSSRRLILELVLLAVGLSAGAAWSAVRLASARQAAHAAAKDLQTCRELAGQIVRLRDRPAVADVREMQAAETATLIERAAAAAKIPAAQSLVSITPETPRRIGESAYKEAPTQVLLRGIGLRQVVAFLCAISAEGSGLRPRSLRLSASREDSAGQWAAEVTVSYLIYAPRSEATSAE